MIIGMVVRVVLKVCRLRGFRVPDLTRLRRRQPRLAVTDRLAERLAEGADGRLPRPRPKGGPRHGEDAGE